MATPAGRGCPHEETRAGPVFFIRSNGSHGPASAPLTPAATARSTCAAATAIGRRATSRRSGATWAPPGLPTAAYDLVTTSLVDEHLADVAALYAEAWRLAEPGGAFVIVGYHPHFIMAAGMPTHYDSASGEPVAIETHVHLLSEHVTAGLGAVWTLAEMRERIVDDAWLALKPKWAELRHPLTFAFAWRKRDGAEDGREGRAPCP
jgi:hypothetical protein